MERTDMRINSETRHVGVIARKDSTCGYWLTIIGLGVAIFVVGFVFWFWSHILVSYLFHSPYMCNSFCYICQPKVYFLTIKIEKKTNFVIFWACYWQEVLRCKSTNVTFRWLKSEQFHKIFGVSENQTNQQLMPKSRQNSDNFYKKKLVKIRIILSKNSDESQTFFLRYFPKTIPVFKTPSEGERLFDNMIFEFFRWCLGFLAITNPKYPKNPSNINSKNCKKKMSFPTIFVS